jgi:hypothetical protein
MARLGYKYKKDLSAGRGYKGGYQGVRFVDEMTSGESTGVPL